MTKPLNLLTVAVTGANSYIGQNFIKFCLNNKINVKAFCRNPDKLNVNFAKGDYIKVFPYSLEKNSNLNLENVNTIIHLAHERVYGARMNMLSDPNFYGAKHLIEQAKLYKIKNIIYLSSHLSHKSTLSQYGKSKLLCENLFINKDFIAVKTGMVFGGNESGLFKLILNQLKSKKIIPIIRSNAPIYPIHINDLNIFLLNLIKSDKKVKNIYYLGNKNSIKLKKFFNQIAIKYYNKKIYFIYLPATIIYLITYFLGYFNGFFNRIFERVAGVLSLKNLVTEENLNQNSENSLKITKNFFQD